MLVILPTLFQVCLCSVSGNDLMVSPEGYSIWLESQDRINFVCYEVSFKWVDFVLAGQVGKGEN